MCENALFSIGYSGTSKVSVLISGESIYNGAKSDDHMLILDTLC